MIGGKYGSISGSSGISFTEMEYRYAIEIGKPCIAFIVHHSVDLPGSKSEMAPDKRAKLEAFKSFIQNGRLCKYWYNAADLGAKVSRSVTQLFRSTPATGWVRADQIARSNNEEVLGLKNQILELERTLNDLRRSDEGADLARGNDEYALVFHLHAQKELPSGSVLKIERCAVGDINVLTTWDELAAVIGPVILHGGDSALVHDAIRSGYNGRITDAAAKAAIQVPRVHEVELDGHVWLQIKLQFVSLGYLNVSIEERERQMLGHPFVDKRERWIPTSAGMLYFGRRSAIKRA